MPNMTYDSRHRGAWRRFSSVVNAVHRPGWRLVQLCQWVKSRDKREVVRNGEEANSFFRAVFSKSQTFSWFQGHIVYVMNPPGVVAKRNPMWIARNAVWRTVDVSGRRE